MRGSTVHVVPSSLSMHLFSIPFLFNCTGAKFCYAPPSLRDIIASALKFHFGVDSVPVIVEIIWLICNALLYLLLAPLAVSIMLTSQ